MSRVELMTLRRKLMRWNLWDSKQLWPWTLRLDHRPFSSRTFSLSGSQVNSCDVVKWNHDSSNVTILCQAQFSYASGRCNKRWLCSAYCALSLFNKTCGTQRRWKTMYPRYCVNPRKIVADGRWVGRAKWRMKAKWDSSNTAKIAWPVSSITMGMSTERATSVTSLSNPLTLSCSYSMLSNSSSFSFVFRSPNRKKSRGLVSGLSGGWGVCRKW
jgi:hypothetical protein